MTRGKTLFDDLAAAPFALAMSSGFFSFFAHAGFLRALEEAGLRPSRISGSSAGALVGATWASGTEVTDLAAELAQLERRDFWDPGLGAGFLRGELFQERMERITGGADFSDCRVPVAVSVFDVRSATTHVIDQGSVANAVVASCAVPLLFHPVRIGGRTYLDGGIRDRPGLAGMPESEKRVLFHHIVSRMYRNDLPEREGMTSLVIEELPRVGPFRLREGKAAHRLAYEATKRALEMPIDERGRVILRAR